MLESVKAQADQLTAMVQTLQRELTQRQQTQETAAAKVRADEPKIVGDWTGKGRSGQEITLIFDDMGRVVIAADDVYYAAKYQCNQKDRNVTITLEASGFTVDGYLIGDDSLFLTAPEEPAHDAPQFVKADRLYRSLFIPPPKKNASGPAKAENILLKRKAK